MNNKVSFLIIVLVIVINEVDAKGGRGGGRGGGRSRGGGGGSISPYNPSKTNFDTTLSKIKSKP